MIHPAVAQMAGDELDRVVAQHRAEAAAAGVDNGGNGSPTLVMQRMADIAAVPLRWLWPAKIPAGKLTLLVGDPGLGKSVITLDLAARVTLGAPWPGNGMKATPGEVIILSAEDDPADTIRPRLEAVGADLERVFIIRGVKRGEGDGYFSLAEDLPLLEAVLTDRVRLMIIDPISAYLGTETDSHRDAPVRAVLAPLAALAARRGPAVLGVMHLNKGQAAAIYRVQGSIAFTAAARAVWAVCKDTEDETGRRRLFLPVKNNLAADVEGLAYDLADCGGLPAVNWGNPVGRDAAEALAHEAPEELRGRKEAEAWLRELLADEPVEAAEIRRAARDNGIAEKTLYRAKKALGIEARKTGFAKGWIWILPDTKMATFAEDGQGGQGREDGHLRRNWPSSEAL